MTKRCSMRRLDLGDMNDLMRGLKRNGGDEVVRQYLNMLYESCKKADTNSYRTALYEALKEREWYIEEYLS